MPNDKEIRNAPNTENADFHPDSKYDNWTVRSYDVTTKYEDIPQWMKMFAESSIDTQEFFKFERFEYKDLNEWQKMLLKLYRKDLHNIILYYEDYRASLVREIMDRERKEKETVSSQAGTRHEICSADVQSALPTLISNTPFKRRSLELSAGSSSTSSSSASPSNSLLPANSPNNTSMTSPIKFKRFGHRSSKNSSKVSTEDLQSAFIIDLESKDRQSKDVASNNSPEASRCASSSPNNHSTALLTDDFESPKLERVIRNERRARGRLGTDLFADPDDKSLHDFPSPQHIRSASSRHSTAVSDFPSPVHIRSASDRPARHSVHTSLLHGSGVFRDSSSSFNTLDSSESLFSRNSSKRGSGRAIASPKLKEKSEPGSHQVTVITDKKEKKLSKLLSRATSFGRKDKSKTRGKKTRDEKKTFEPLEPLDLARKSRKDDYLVGKETVV